MVMRIGGLASGMDIDALVEKLMNAERAPLNKLQQKKQTYEWQRDAYRSVNTKLKTFDTYIADNLVLKTLNSKTATSSNSNLVSATATGKASGTLSIEGVSQLASAARAVGDQVSAIGSTKMSDLIGAGTKTIELSAIKADGTIPAEATKIEITDDMTVDQFVSKVNASNAGVNAVFENGRFSFTAKNSGDNKAGDEIQMSEASKQIFHSLGFFKGTDGAFDSTKAFQTTEGKNAVFQVNGIATERASNSFTISGYNVTLKDTFNGTQTIAEKYTAAEKELKLATTNLLNKKAAFDTAAKNYYGSSNVADVPNYTSSHDAAYVAVFGNTLSLSQQEQYKKLSNADWKDLTSGGFNTIKGADSTDPVAIRAAVDASSLSEEEKTKLKALSDDKLKALANTSEADFDEFKKQANYEAFGGSKLKTLTGDAVTALKALQIDEDTDLASIHTAIDGSDKFSDDLKSALKALDKDALKSLQSSEPTTLTDYANRAEADSLKQTYAQLGDKAIASLSSDTPNEAAFTADQKAAWDALTAEQKTAFKTLASENIDRSAYKNAEAELAAANQRQKAADDGFETAYKDAEDAKILKSDGANGMVLDNDVVNNAPKAQAVTMTSTTNIDEMVNKIKDFVTTYNGLIKDLSDQTKQSKYRDYAPLTDEQKKEMSEDEIKLWEEKAKSGLLRNDSLIRNGLSDMRSLIYQSNPAVEDSRYNTLFSIGITTSKNYNDGGTLEIDEDKLRKALEENPDAVEQLFKNSDGVKSDPAHGGADTRGYLAKLRESMKTLEINIEKKAGRSTMTDAQYTIGKNLMDTETRIKTWQDKLKTIEDRYWKQFTAMESAINKANQQSSLFMQG